jgi:hypothetical protein
MSRSYDSCEENPVKRHPRSLRLKLHFAYVEKGFGNQAFFLLVLNNVTLIFERLVVEDTGWFLPGYCEGPVVWLHGPFFKLGTIGLLIAAFLLCTHGMGVIIGAILLPLSIYSNAR